MSIKKLVLLTALTAALSAHAQSAPVTSGTLVIVPAFGQVKHANDEATVTFAVEEQDKEIRMMRSRATCTGANRRGMVCAGADEPSHEHGLPEDPADLHTRGGQPVWLPWEPDLGCRADARS